MENLHIQAGILGLGGQLRQAGSAVFGRRFCKHETFAAMLRNFPPTKLKYPAGVKAEANRCRAVPNLKHFLPV